jgi:hypothetical protein
MLNQISDPHRFPLAIRMRGKYSLPIPCFHVMKDSHINIKMMLNVESSGWALITSKANVRLISYDIEDRNTY